MNIEQAIVLALYLAFFLAIFAWLIVNKSRGANELGVRVMLLLPSIAVLSAGPIVDGLEYEDAYIHKAAAQYQIHHPSTGTDNFYTKACIAGSESDCILDTTFGTQLIGFSTLIAQVAKFLPDGFDIRHLSNLLSVLFTSLTLQLVWSCLSAASTPIKGRFLGLALLLTSPSYYVMSVSSFAEPLFTFFLMASYFFYFTCTEEKNSRVLRLFLFFTAIIIAVLVKKEGILISFIFMAVSIFDLYIDRRNQEAWIKVFLIGSVFLISIFAFNLQEAEVRHSSDIGTLSFNISFIKVLGQRLLEAAISPFYFGLLWIGFLVSTAFTILSKFSRINLHTLIAFLCIVSYVFIYSLHARHYWFIQDEDVHPREMVRYLYILMPFAVIAIAGTFSQFMESFPNTKHAFSTVKSVPFLVILFIGVLYLTLQQATYQRFDIANMELRRINIDRVSVSPEKIYISSSSLAAYAYLDDKTKIVDFVSLSVPLIQQLVLSHKAEQIIFLFNPNQYCNKAIQKRWGKQCEFLDIIKKQGIYGSRGL